MNTVEAADSADSADGADGAGAQKDTLCDYLAAAAQRHPDAVAVSLRENSATYGELDKLSAALAETLAGSGVGPGDRVGIWLPKSVEAVVAIHAVLKLGAAYVPVDPVAPVRRAAYILGDCRVRGLVTTREHLALLDDATLRELDLSLAVLVDGPTGPSPRPPFACLGWAEAISRRTGAEQLTGARAGDLAYILYTSGSTGAPKGVMLSHRNGRVFVDWALQRFGITADDRLASHAPFMFDLSIFDIFAAAGAAAHLVLVPENWQSLGQALNRLVIDEGVTVWYSVPNALVRMLSAANGPLLAGSSLRVVLFAGEVFPVKHLRQLRDAVPAADLYNLYGPTETNVCTFYQVGSDDVGPERTQPVPIGRVCDYATATLIDESGQPLDGPDAVGELCIGGDSVMLGYWGDPGRTAQRLVPSSRDGHGAVYRTGDVVRSDGRGDLVFIGRRDHMVKVRGYRIELGEIETVLLAHADVVEAAVVAVPDGGGATRLEAFVVSGTPGEPTQAQLRRHCLETLPRYMLPERVHLLDSLPVTPTGKIDRPALAASLDALALGPRT